ncbi:hypothetical protein OG21DRAFT_1500452 [Imleria badia]|nr:hypothetical protein OG21DRAFT_1500452 [Imleria badia]
MNTANTARSVVAISIKDIEHRTSARRKVVARRYYVRFSVGDTSRSTNATNEANSRTSWDNVFHFDGDDSSLLLINVYQKHRFGDDEVVGNLTDTIGGVLGKLNDDVFEDTFRKDASDGSDHLGYTIKFALAVELHQQTHANVDADERQAQDAVTRATEAVDPLSSTTTVVGQVFETTWNVLMQRMELFNKSAAGIAQIHPYISLAWSVVSAANQVLVNQKNRDEQIVRLAGTMSDVFAFVDDAEPLKHIKKHIKIIELLIQQVTECGYFIAEYAKRKNFWLRTAKYMISDINTIITGYEEKFRELKTAFLDGLAVQEGVTVFRMMNVVEEAGNKAEMMALDDMPYARGAKFQREKGCLLGTRETFLRETCDILNNPEEDAPRVCLLTGVAGSGKSAVAHSIARLFDKQQRLGSSYCFARSDVANRNPENLFTIARNLSDHDPQYKFALWQIVKDDRALRTSSSPMEQVEKFIIEPSQHLHAIGPLVIVIDALDESGDESRRRQLLCAISEKISRNALPTNLRFLITSRPETDILKELPPGSQIVYKQMGDIPHHVVDNDMQKFIWDSLQQYTELESFWPNQGWCQLLVHHSQRLFQWASTACNFIRGDGATGLALRERFEILLEADYGEDIQPLDNLYQLYQTILNQRFTSRFAQQRFREVMAIVLALHEPLSITSLCTLFVGHLSVREIIKPLGSLLDGVVDEEKPIRPLHTSFHDFLLNEARSSVFHVHIQPRDHLSLGQALLACMHNMLRFNICDLKDSRICNTTIPDLQSQINTVIPPYLGYSCQYWMHHLQHVSYTPELLAEVTLFFNNVFPYWLEAISLLSLSSPLSSILSALEGCTILNKWAKGQEVATLASEAFQFIQVFAPVLRESTPHLYLSAMPQTPTSSPLCELWVDHLQKHVSFSSGHPASWPAEIHTLQGHKDAVTSVACSPDGTQIVSGSWDFTIRVWNVTTGQCVAGPFKGHTDIVTSVVFSPDGTHIVSASEDKTIRVWNATTGQCVGPLQGHTDWVTSVAYSPDGNHIVSGSWDETIMVWNATIGQCVAGPFLGHIYVVTSVAYSPDGNYIVSGSWDKTIRVWNATTGQCVAGPFLGHLSGVTSVAYSPDGIHIVSGSRDETIRVWNATTGQCVAKPFQGHTHFINSVAYSPNGTHIVSGSYDKTIRVWNATTGQSVACSFKGHTKTVTSVAYSPNGHIVSGSDDNTIRVWNATTGQCVPGSFKGHILDVMSIAYSPDGNHIVSDSCDKTTRVWNATTGQFRRKHH